MVAALMLERTSPPDFDARNWQESLRSAYWEAREVYRSFPRATLISLDETVSASRIDPQRIRLAEDMLRFFTEVGLSLEQSLTARTGFLIDVFGFVLLIDYRYDRVEEPVRAVLGRPVPLEWLEAHPEVPAPLARSAAEGRSATNDEMFEDLVAMRILAIEQLIVKA